MKLFIYGKMFGRLDTMTVTGENGEELYYLKQDKEAGGHVVTLSDANGVKIADIEQRGISGAATFAVLMNGAEVAVIERKFSLAPNYYVKGPDWDISGSLFSTKYKVLKGDETIAELKVALLKSEIEVEDDTDLALKVAVTMAIRFALCLTDVVSSAVTTGVIVAH